MSVEDKDKVILKNNSYQGVVLSEYDFSLLSSVPFSKTVVTKQMWKERRRTYLGVKQFANKPGDVIQIGSLKKLYRIIKFVRREGTMMGKGGDIIMVKRIDGAVTADLDIDNAKKGSNIKVLNRRSFEELLDHPLGRDYEEPCKVLPTKTGLCNNNDDDCNC